MGQEITQDSILKQLADLQVRIRRLETAPRMPNTTQQGGTYELESEDGSLTYFQFGTYLDNNGNEQFGMFVAGTGIPGERTFEIGSHGLHIPAIPLPMLDPNYFKTVTSATYVDVWVAGSYFATTANAIKTGSFVRAVDALSGGTVSVYNGTDATSDVVIAVGNVAGQFVTFNWLHGQEIGAGPFAPAWRAKGTGNGIQLSQPTTSFMVNGDYIGATLTGL